MALTAADVYVDNLVEDEGRLVWTFKVLPWHGWSDVYVFVTDDWGAIDFEESFRLDRDDLAQAGLAAKKWAMEEGEVFWVCHQVMRDYAARTQLDKIMRERAARSYRDNE